MVGDCMSVERIADELLFRAPLIAAFASYSALLATAFFAPKAHKRFLLFIGGVPICFFILAFFSAWAAEFAVTVVPVGAFLVSFYQFWIEGFSKRIAAAAIFLQVLGIAFTLWWLVRLIRCYST